MLSILATGEARYNTNALNNNLKFDNQSAIVGENAGKDLKIGAAILRNNNLQWEDASPLAPEGYYKK